MSAYEIPNIRFSLEAGGNVERRRFVTVNATEKGTQAAADSLVIGASMVDAKSGEVLEVADGIVIVESAEAIAAGTSVSSDANGKAIATPVDGVVAGVAVTTTTVVGEYISVKI